MIFPSKDVCQRATKEKKTDKRYEQEHNFLFFIFILCLSKTQQSHKS